MGTLSFVRRHSTLAAFTVSLAASGCFVACGSDSNGGTSHEEAGAGGSGGSGGGTTGGSSGSAGKAGAAGSTGGKAGGGGTGGGAAGSGGKAGSGGTGMGGGQPVTDSGPDVTSNGDAADAMGPDGN
jgi:hypothetical protein